VAAKQHQSFDVAIVGAGPVGATAAILAAGNGRRIAIFEARAQPGADRRTLALSHASRARLEEAGAWPAEHATPITSIHISQRGGPGRTLLQASEQAVPALGYTVAFSALAAALEARLAAKGVEVRWNHACEGIDLTPEEATLRFPAGGEASARLLVLADGGANAGRIPGIAYVEKDYGQSAVVASVTTDRAHGHRAYERFTPAGPVALLPVGDAFALIWTATAPESERLLTIDPPAFLAELQSHFGDRAGRFREVSGRASFALRLRRVNVPVALRTAIIGNAAQTLHPIAGQGLNLGLRDAASLAAAIGAAAPAELGGADMLEAYRESRHRDASRGIAFTDFLVSSFLDGRYLPRWGRGMALTALDLFPPARRALAKRMIHGALR